MPTAGRRLGKEWGVVESRKPHGLSGITPGEAEHTWSAFAGGGSRGVGGDRCGWWGSGFVCVFGREQ